MRHARLALSASHRALLRRSTGLTGIAIATAFGGMAHAQPSNPQIVTGGITVTQPSATSTLVTQTGEKGIINWKGGMDVNGGESLQFAVPGANSITLNRIANGKPTNIDGSLTSNGRVVIVNGSGTFFGAGSQVNVGSLVATTADIANGDFIDGKMNFTKASPNDHASIVNKGTITAAEGGLVALVAPAVRNDGVIEAKLGKVQLASGKSFSAVDLYGDGLYSFKINDNATAKGRDDQGKDMNSAVENRGTIRATGGTVLLTANAAKSVVDTAINTSGIIEASSASVDKTGAIVLDGGEGAVKVSNKLSAAGSQIGAKGGDVQITGGTIQLASATIDATGAAGGGHVVIGGGAQGKGPIPHATNVGVDATSVIDVSATSQGKGGNVTVWSDKRTDFAGTIRGKGVKNAGGAAEVSSQGTLNFTGLADLGGTTNGTLLLDPTDINIGIAEAASYSATLATGTNVTVATGSTGPGNGDITLNAPITWFGTGDLTLNAFRNVTLNSGITSIGGATTIVAGKDIALNGATLGGLANAVTLKGVDISLNGSSLISTLGNITINNSGVFSSATANSLNAFGGSTITLNQSAAGKVQNAVDAVGVHGTATLNLDSGVFNEHFILSRDNFALVGSGAATTYIRPTSLSGAPVGTLDGNTYRQIIYVGGDNVKISGLTVVADGLPTPVGAYAIGAQAANGLNVQNTILTADGGFSIVNSNNVTLANNIVIGNKVGLYGSKSNGLTATGNYLQGLQGVRMDNLSGAQILANALVSSDGTGKGVGILGNNVTNYNIGANSVSAGNTGMELTDGGPGTLVGNNILAGNYGVNASGVGNVTINANSITVDPTFFVPPVPPVPGSIPTPSTGNVAIILSNSYNVNIANNYLKASYGITGNAVDTPSIASNNIEAAITGIILSNGQNATISTNLIKAPGTGVALLGEKNATISTNEIDNANLGIDADTVNGLTATSNLLSNVGNGLLAESVTGLNATFNTAKGRGDADSVGFLITNSDNANLASNYVQFFTDGIHLVTSNNAALSANFTGNATRGIYLDNSTGATGNGGNLLSDNTTGILVANGSNNAILDGNFFSTNGLGIAAENVDGIVASNNNFFGGTDGIRFTGVTSGQIATNTLNAQSTGVNGVILENSNGVQSNGNSITGYTSGLRATNSLLLNSTGDTFSQNAFGIQLDNSSFARIVSASIDTKPFGTGLSIANGSGNTIVRDSVFTGGDVAVRISDAGSSMQFENNGSKFDGMNQYFVLENGAMVGTTLDASAQTFAGIRASDFTVAQRDAAENITTDVADNATLGNVFYKDFAPEPVTPPAPPTVTPPVLPVTPVTPPAPPAASASTPNLSALNEFQLNRQFLFRDGLFSFAGRTITNNVAQTPFSFQVAAINLSLLNPASGSASPVSAVQLANLSTAAGGTGSGEASGAEQLANLTPAAGPSTNCGNSFLGTGFEVGFQVGTCSVNAAQ